jgi:hypothetical protein
LVVTIFFTRRFAFDNEFKFSLVTFTTRLGTGVNNNVSPNRLALFIDDFLSPVVNWNLARQNIFWILKFKVQSS